MWSLLWLENTVGVGYNEFGYNEFGYNEQLGLVYFFQKNFIVLTNKILRDDVVIFLNFAAVFSSRW